MSCTVHSTMWRGFAGSLHAVRRAVGPGARALLLAAAVSGPVRAGDWPCWRGPHHDGISPETEWSSAGEEEPLWTEEVGLGYSSPSIAAGRLVTLGYRGESEESGEDVLVALDVDTGAEIWRHAWDSKLWNNMHEGGTLTTPTLAGGRVYVLSRLGTLRCLDLETGELKWQRAIDEEFGVTTGPFGLCTSPLLVDGQVIVNVGKTIAFAADSGETDWETEDYGYSYGTPLPFEREGDPFLAVFNGAGLVLLDRLLGDEWMRHPWTSNFNVNCATPIVTGNRIFISTGYDDKGCALLDASGEELEVLWESKAMRNKMSGCVLFEDHLYGFDDAVLECLDLDGEEHWRERGLGTGALSLAGGRLLVLSEEGQLLVAEARPEGFEPLARRRVFREGVCWTPPVLSDGRIFCRNNRGTLVCRDHRPKAAAGK